MPRPMALISPRRLHKIPVLSDGAQGEDLYQELLAEDRAREEAQAAEAAAKVAAAQAAAGVLDEDAEVAEAETGTVEE